ncbi:DUF4352 domain-containing protein, partial [Streptomyces sp. NPDC058953]|uniref:DUF4352 domain-containing protein n=1 Tax=Streptomyces sp. NPDC058953 TaxID=3346676 RepID=UPI0036772FA9
RAPGASPAPPAPPAGPPGPGGGGPGPLRNGLGTAALVIGLIGAAVAWIPFVFFVGGTLGLIALIMGLKGRGRARRGEASNGRAAAAGAAIGAAAMALATVGTYLTVQVTSDAVDEVKKDIAASGSPSTEQGGGGTGDADGAEGDGSGLGGDKKGKGKKGKGKSKGLGGGDSGGSDGPLAVGGSATYPDGVKVTVTTAPKDFRPSDYAAGHKAGNQAYKVTVVIENTGDKGFDSTLTTTEARAGTEGVTAEQIFDDTVDTGFEGTILPGRKATVTYGFSTPATAKDLTLEISPGMSHDPAQWELAL